MGSSRNLGIRFLIEIRYTGLTMKNKEDLSFWSLPGFAPTKPITSSSGCQISVPYNWLNKLFKLTLTPPAHSQWKGKKKERKYLLSSFLDRFFWKECLREYIGRLIAVTWKAFFYNTICDTFIKTRSSNNSISWYLQEVVQEISLIW